MRRRRTVRQRRSTRLAARRAERQADSAQHPVDLGRLYVNEGNTTLAAHKLFEMERRAGG